MASNSWSKELRIEDFSCIEGDEGDLGGGAQSAVRLVDHRTLGRVAVKCFSVTGNPNDREKLTEKVKKELNILQQTADDSVVRIHGWVKWPKAMGLVMEYLPAGSLRQFANNSLVKLTPKLILRMATEIASVLARMHNLPTDERIIHGDVKPDNVLLTRDLHCKLGDFGSAELQALTGGTTTTGEARKMHKTQDMTMAYAAPEKLTDLNIKPKKEQDTYSFGMLLYVLLAGVTPYQNPSHEIAFMELIKRGERPNTAPIDELKATLDSNGKDIIARLESIMRKCWQQDPSNRPSMTDVRDELQELRDQQNESDILADVSEAVKCLKVSKPIAKSQRRVELQCFSPLTGTFMKGTTYNIYNLPNVQQAAIECNRVDFEASANAASNDPLLNRDTTARSSISSSTSSPTSPGQPRPSVSSADAPENDERVNDDVAADSMSLSSFTSSSPSHYQPFTNTKVTTGGLSAQATKIESHAINRENSSVIGPIGGVIEIGGCRLVIGQNALDSEVRITLKSVYGGSEVKEGLITTLLKCEPSGLKFKKTVLVRLYTCYVTDEPAVVQVRRSKDRKKWENIKQLLHTDKSFFEFAIKGFSWYAAWLKSVNNLRNSRKRKSLIYWTPSGNRPVNRKILRCSVDDDVPGVKKKPANPEEEWELQFSVKNTEKKVSISLNSFNSSATNEDSKHASEIEIIRPYRDVEICRQTRNETSFELRWVNNNNKDHNEMKISVATAGDKPYDQEFYIAPPVPAAPGNVSINVENAYGDIAAGSMTKTINNQQTMERDLNPAATEFPTTSSSHGSLSSQAFTNKEPKYVKSRSVTTKR